MQVVQYSGTCPAGHEDQRTYELPDEAELAPVTITCDRSIEERTAATPVGVSLACGLQFDLTPVLTD